MTHSGPMVQRLGLRPVKPAAAVRFRLGPNNFDLAARKPSDEYGGAAHRDVLRERVACPLLLPKNPGAVFASVGSRQKSRLDGESARVSDLGCGGPIIGDISNDAVLATALLSPVAQW